MEKILTLLELLSGVREKQTVEEFHFFALNETKRLIDYDLAAFWTTSLGKIKIQDLSGNRTLDGQGPFAQKIESLIKEALEKDAKQEDDKERGIQFSEYYIEEGKETHFYHYNAIIIFRDKKENILGGLFLQKLRKPFDKKDHGILEELGKAYSYTYRVLQNKAPSQFSLLGIISSYRRWVVLGFLLLCFIPVRLSVSAPAEIVARQPFAVTAPYDGTIKAVKVDPASTVSEGDALIEMDATILQSQFELAQQKLKAAQNNLSSARRNLLSNSQSREQIGTLEAEIERQRIEADYAQELLEKKDITALQDGIAIFSDVNALVGKPVQTGEQIMFLADPDDQELLIRVPVDALIPFSDDAPVTFYLNVSPLSQKSAVIKVRGYQASPDPDGLLTYKIRADIDGQVEARVGLKGHAKIHGDWTILAYSILRRPLISLRKMIGL